MTSIDGGFVKQVTFLVLLIISLHSFGATIASGDYYTTSTDFTCLKQPVIQVNVNFDLKTFKNSYIDNQFKQDNFTPPADQAFSEKETCYSPPGWERQYCAIAKFNAKTVTVSQYYKDYGHAYGVFTESYTFSNDLNSFKRSINNSICNHMFAPLRKASKNDLLLKNGAIFTASKEGDGFLSDPTGLTWVDVIRKNDQVVAVNYKEAKSYCESKSMKLPSAAEAQILLHYMKDSSPIKVVGTNYFMEELFPEFSKYYYWDNDHWLYSVGNLLTTDENNRYVPFDGTPIGVRCVVR